MAKDPGVAVKVHRKFFDEIFEPARRGLEKETGMRIGQLDFTEFLAKKKIKLRLPKNKFNLKSEKPTARKTLPRGFKLI